MQRALESVRRVNGTEAPSTRVATPMQKARRREVAALVQDMLKKDLCSKSDFFNPEKIYKRFSFSRSFGLSDRLYFKFQKWELSAVFMLTSSSSSFIRLYTVWVSQSRKLNFPPIISREYLAIYSYPSHSITLSLYNPITLSLFLLFSLQPFSLLSTHSLSLSLSYWNYYYYYTSTLQKNRRDYNRNTCIGL